MLSAGLSAKQILEMVTEKKRTECKLLAGRHHVDAQAELELVESACQPFLERHGLGHGGGSFGVYFVDEVVYSCAG